jgi:hypothetical protein
MESMMDYSQAIAILKQQRTILDTTIATLERLSPSEPWPVVETKIERRGRKVMLPEEREIVSARMKKYWAERRNDKTTHAGSAA